MAAGQNTPDLTVSAVNLNGATIADAAGNNASVSGTFNPTGTLQIDTTSPTVSSVAPSGSGISNGNGDLNAGHVVTLTLTMSEAVTVNTTGGTPTLTLNDGGSATYTGGSGSNVLTFSYTVAAGQNTPDLTVSARQSQWCDHCRCMPATMPTVSGTFNLDRHTADRHHATRSAGNLRATTSTQQPPSRLTVPRPPGAQ